MKIPIQQILDKMQIELELAKQTSNEAVLREKLAIIQALCEVALVQQTEKTEPLNIKNVQVVKQEEEIVSPNTSLLDF